MIIYFLRHGDAVEDSHAHDSDRPLSEFGQQQASAAGQFLSKSKSGIEQIFCSPLLRARQTAEAVQRELGSIPVHSTEQLTSSSEPRNILLELQKVKEKSVLLVGHEPHLSSTISLLLFGGDRSVVEMRKCSLACVSATPPIGKGGAILQWLVSSEQTMKK